MRPDGTPATGPDDVDPAEVLDAEPVAPEEGPPAGSTSSAKGQLKPSAELLRFVPDIGRLLWRLARDPAVPWQAKLVAGSAAAYVVSPLDVLPDVIPGVGQLDDVFIVVKGLKYLFKRAGYDKVREHWSGTDEGFALMLMVTGIER